jgi:hypothetical protein
VLIIVIGRFVSVCRAIAPRGSPIPPELQSCDLIPHLLRCKFISAAGGQERKRLIISDIDLPAFAERFELDLDGLKRLNSMKEFFVYLTSSPP